MPVRVQVLYDLSKEARKRLLLEGKDASRGKVAEFAVEADDPDFRRLLDAVPICDPPRALLALGADGNLALDLSCEYERVEGVVPNIRRVDYRREFDSEVGSFHEAVDIACEVWGEMQEFEERARAVRGLRKILGEPLGLRFREYQSLVSQQVRDAAGDVVRFAKEFRKWYEGYVEEARVAREKAEEEKDRWISEHGSMTLRRMHGSGYPCQRLYVEERAAMDLGGVEGTGPCGWVADLRSESKIESRVEPTSPAMDFADMLKAKGYDSARVAWVSRGIDSQKASSDSMAPFEAVVVDGFLGRYRVFRRVPRSGFPEVKQAGTHS